MSALLTPGWLCRLLLQPRTRDTGCLAREDLRGEVVVADGANLLEGRRARPPGWTWSTTARPFSSTTVMFSSAHCCRRNQPSCSTSAPPVAAETAPRRVGGPLTVEVAGGAVHVGGVQPAKQEPVERPEPLPVRVAVEVAVAALHHLQQRGLGGVRQVHPAQGRAVGEATLLVVEQRAVHVHELAPARVEPDCRDGGGPRVAKAQDWRASRHDGDPGGRPPGGAGARRTRAAGRHRGCGCSSATRSRDRGTSSCDRACGWSSRLGCGRSSRHAGPAPPQRPAPGGRAGPAALAGRRRRRVGPGPALALQGGAASTERAKRSRDVTGAQARRRLPAVPRPSAEPDPRPPRPGRRAARRPGRRAAALTCSGTDTVCCTSAGSSTQVSSSRATAASPSAGRPGTSKVTSSRRVSPAWNSPSSTTAPCQTSRAPVGRLAVAACLRTCGSMTMRTLATGAT